jgi:hypothetical protein
MAGGVIAQRDPFSSSSPGFFTSTYGFTIGISGLMYGGMGVGFLLATAVGARFFDILYRRVIF